MWHERRWVERRQQCRHCGRSREVCSDPERLWYPQREVCFATMEREASNARYARLHEDEPWHDGTFANWAKEPSWQYPHKYDMGVTIGVAETDLRPDDPFLTRKRAPIVPPPDEEPEGASNGDQA